MSSKSFLNIMLAASVSIGLASPAFAQFNPGSEASGVSGGGPKTEVEVIAEAPGKATLKFTGVNVNFLNGVPAKLKPHLSKPDDTGRGQANIVAVGDYPEFFGKYKFVLRGVGADWNTVIPGQLQGDTAIVQISVPTGRSATFMVVPVLEGGGQQIWVTHPENARFTLSCTKTKPVIATGLTIQSDGLIRIAEDGEVGNYGRNPDQFWCPGS